MKHYNFTKFAFLLLFISMCFQYTTIIDFGNFSFKLFHLVSLLFLPFIFKKGKIVLPKLMILAFFVYLIIVSVINFPIYGFNNLLLNWIFGLYLIIIILNSNLKAEDWIDIIKKGSLLMLFLIVLNIVKNYREVINFLSHASANGHPDFLNIYFNGGVNIEATWIALLGIFFYNDKRQFLYYVLSSIISIIYVSRCGILLNVLLFAIYFYNKIKDKKFNKINIIFLLFLLIIMLAYSYEKGFLNYILMRLLSIGSDKGSDGRLRMWKYIFDAFLQNPFGYGVGNSLVAIQNVSPLVYKDHNIHNIYFQMLLDAGFIGLIYYLIIIFKFVTKNIKNLFKNPIVLSIICYLMIGLLEFRGGDSVLFFLVGVYLNISNKRKLTEG